MAIPVLSIVGKSGSGKTTLLEKIIPELKRRGYRVATVKHHSHPGLEIDQPGKDTWRHAQAGSDLVILAAPDKLASFYNLEHQLSLDEIISKIDGVDIILTEGFKLEAKLALEVLRGERGLTLISKPAQLTAIASDVLVEAAVPVFPLDDATAIVDWIVDSFLR